MPRRGRVEKRKISPDSKYNSELVQRFINRIMLKGKKTKAEKIVYRAFEIISQQTKKDPLKIFEQAVKNVTPELEVKPRRVGGSTYQVPVEVSLQRGIALAMQWIRDVTRERSGKSTIEKLAAELLEAANNSGLSVKKRENMHRTAEANKAFAHFRW